jgi:hypothetical protein
LTLVFTICVVDPLKVEGVSDRFFAFVDEEDGTIMQDFGSMSVARKQRERINFLIRALNNVYLHPSTTTTASDFILSVLLADDEDVDDLGRLHLVSIARFNDDDDDDDDDDDEDGDDDKD